VCCRGCRHRQDATRGRGHRDGPGSWCLGVSAFCESHTSDVPFVVIERLLRDAARITQLDDEAAPSYLIRRR
jgi:hypothetical protein